MAYKELSLFIFLLVFINVDCEIEGPMCTRSVTFTQSRGELATRRRLETYYTFSGWCYPRGCRRTRWRYENYYNTVVDTKRKVVNDCCPGYVEESRQDSNVTCRAVCSPACTNGFCARPGVCECSPGYVTDPNNVRNCLPVCLEGTCEHGTCVAPNDCKCNFGYARRNNTCEPICSEPCYNGTCTAPETCECSPGYRKSERNLCEPYCSAGCDNGACVGPETCRCNEGYRMAESNSSYSNQTCAPVCTDPCQNGICVAPDMCTCLPGYNKTSHNICAPVCSNGCPNGTCVAPDTCRCNKGWIAHTIEGNCEPVCSKDCGNGTCVAPETCECFPGYYWILTCIPRCVDGCDGGVCVGPNICECDNGWEYIHGACVPTCSHACGNGTCVKPNTCNCFTGYHMDVLSAITNSSTQPVCTPLCTNCSGICVAPNVCENEMFETTTLEVDYIDASTLNDDFEADYNETLNNTSPFTKEQPNADAVVSWLKQNWTVVALPVLLVVTTVAALVIIIRWRFLTHYCKGRSYTVQGNISDSERPSSFEDVSFLALEKKQSLRD